jgi:fumarate reductase subunit C
LVEDDTERQYREIRQADKTWWQRNASYFMFAIPAFCDATATTMLNLGLFYVSFQLSNIELL